MDMKAVLVAIYLLFLIAITVRISSMKVMNGEATTYLVLAVVLGVVVLVVQRKGCGCGCKCGKDKKKENFMGAELSYSMSLTDKKQ